MLTEIFHRLFETLLEVMAIGETGQRIKARKLLDLGFGGAFVGDVFVQINPSAAIERLGVDPNGATLAKFMHLGEGCAGGNSGSKPFEPGLHVISRRLIQLHFLAPKFADAFERCAGGGGTCGEAVEFDVAAIAYQQFSVRVEHR